MTRSAIPIELQVLNTVDALTGDTVDTTNYHSLAAGGDVTGLTLIFDHSGGTDGTVVVKAGDNPPAFEAGLGDLTLTITAGAVNAFCIDGARFVQSDGTINVDVYGGDINATKVYAVRTPRGL